MVFIVQQPLRARSEGAGGARVIVSVVRFSSVCNNTVSGHRLGYRGGVEKLNPDTTRYGYHHLTGQTSLLLAPRATRLCQTNAKSVNNTAPMPTGANRNDHDILFDTTTSGSMPAGG